MKKPILLRPEVHLVLLCVNVALAAFDVFALLAWGAWFNGLLVPFNIACAWWNVRLYRKAKASGSNRQPEEDSQDPDPLTITISASAAPFTHAIANSVYLAHYSTSTGANVETPKLEEVETELPILAHRSARLRFDGTDRYFAPINGAFGPFKIEATAVCNRPRLFMESGTVRVHTAPSVNCECGFYALPPDMRSTYDGHEFVTLLVELSGTVIEHEHGYRAGHQTVVECQLPPCPFCGSQADVLVVKDYVMEAATCLAHRCVPAPGEVTLTVEDVSALLPVPVTRLGRVRSIA